VATCIPTIASELHAFDKEAWIGTAYLWSSVTFTPLYGRLSDIIGVRPAYEQALLLFTVGTALCVMAPSLGALAAARFIAGMGGGGMGTVSSILTARAFPPAERAFYQGLGFAVFGAGLGLGGPIGGWLTQHFGWRAAFYCTT
jgi:MFS family permease